MTYRPINQFIKQQRTKGHLKVASAKEEEEGQHPLTGQRANFRLLAKQ